MELVGPVGGTRSDAIHGALRRAILDGTYGPDAALPSERQLSEELGASRHAVREALKRLQQAGLVAISQGGATRVRDWRRHGGLDLLLALGATGERPPEELGLERAMFEMRAAVGADAARLAARRASAAQRAELVALSARLAGLDDLAARTAVYDVFWDTIITASGNLAYRLALNTLVAGQEVLSFDASVVASEVADPPSIMKLANDIHSGGDGAAFDTARSLLVRSIPESEV